MSPMKPIRHSKAKAKTIPMVIVEKFIKIVEMRLVTRLLIYRQSTPRRLAA